MTSISAKWGHGYGHMSVYRRLGFGPGRIEGARMPLRGLGGKDAVFSRQLGRVYRGSILLAPA